MPRAALRDRKDPTVLRVRQALIALPAPLAPLVCLASREFPAPSDLKVPLAHPGYAGRPGPAVRAALRARPDQVDRLVSQASLACRVVQQESYMRRLHLRTASTWARSA